MGEGTNHGEYATHFVAACRLSGHIRQIGRLPFFKHVLACATAIWEGPPFVSVASSSFLMSPESVQSLIVVLIGFAVAGLLASGYQLVTERPLSFRLLNGGAKPLTFLAVPVLTFAAPFVIMRNVVRGRRIERRRIEFVALATIIAGFWSLMSGTVVVTAFSALSQLFA